MERLDHHFSDEYKKAQQDIDSSINKIKLEKDTLEKFIAVLFDPARLYSELSADYQKNTELLKGEVEKYTKTLDELISSLEDKKLDPFKVKQLPFYTDNSKEIVNALAQASTIIQKHNSKVENFKTELEQTEELLLSHYAAEFIVEQKYFETLDKISATSELVQQKLKEKEEKSAEILSLEAQLSDSVKGAEKINEYIHKFFRNDELRLENTEDGKFKLMRGKITAENLSEGEKTAIALAYFMAKLEDKDTKLEECIVFIDDPISSLDHNHIFNIYSFIKSRLTNCEQLFISTHNLEFLNLIKDFLHDMYDRKKREQLPCYLVVRERNEQTDRSVIIDMPPVLKKYRSEYAYIFSLIYGFHSEPREDYEMLYILPNAIRRFLEGYTGLRYPDGSGFASKLDRLIPDEIERNAVIKFVHEYSHLQSSERLLKFPPIAECKEIIEIIIKNLCTVDKDHYDALCNGMGIEQVIEAQTA